jgi:hypothetical protein
MFLPRPRRASNPAAKSLIGLRAEPDDLHSGDSSAAALDQKNQPNDEQNTRDDLYYRSVIHCVPFLTSNLGLQIGLSLYRQKLVFTPLNFSSAR